MGSHLSDVWFQVTDLPVVSGSGCTGHHGRRHRVPRLHRRASRSTSTGHCHPKVVAAIQEQAAKFIHAQVNCYRHPLLEQLGERLAEHHPRRHRHVLLRELRRRGHRGRGEAGQAGDRPAERRSCSQGSFHGRTHLTMAMTTSKHGLPRRARAAAGRRVRRAVPAPVARGASARTSRSSARWPRSTPPARADRAGRDRGDGASSRCSAKAATSPRRRRSCAASGDLPGARDPVRRRRGADRLRAHRHDVRDRARGRASRT